MKFVSFAEKQLKTKIPNKPNMQFSKHAKTHRKNQKKQKKQSLSNHVPRNHVTKSWLLSFGFFVFGEHCSFSVSLSPSLSLRASSQKGNTQNS
jgi:hypothetical protein